MRREQPRAVRLYASHAQPSLLPSRTSPIDCRRTGDLNVVVVGRAESSDELGRIDVETGGHLEQVVQVEVASAALDLPKEGPVDPAFVREGLLAEAESFAVCSDAFTEDLGGW